MKDEVDQYRKVIGNGAFSILLVRPATATATDRAQLSSAHQSALATGGLDYCCPLKVHAVRRCGSAVLCCCAVKGHAAHACRNRWALKRARRFPGPKRVRAARTNLHARTRRWRLQPASM